MFLLYFIYKCIYSFAINVQISSTDAKYFDKRVFLLMIFISTIELDNVTGELLFFSPESIRLHEQCMRTVCESYSQFSL